MKLWPGVNFTNMFMQSFADRRSQKCKNSVERSVSFGAFEICMHKNWTENVGEINPRLWRTRGTGTRRATSWPRTELSTPWSWPSAWSPSTRRSWTIPNITNIVNISGSPVKGSAIWQDFKTDDQVWFVFESFNNIALCQIFQNHLYWLYETILTVPLRVWAR